MTTAEPKEADSRLAEAQPFQADVAKLLHLMVHSVYSDKSVFLRAVDHHHPARGAADDRRADVRRAAIEPRHLLSVVGGDPGNRHPDRRIQGLSAKRQSH